MTSEHLIVLLLAFESGFRCSRNGGSPVMFKLFPISTILIMFRDYYCGIFGYFSKHCTLKKYLLVVIPGVMSCITLFLSSVYYKYVLAS